MTSWTRNVLVGMAGVFAACLLLWEAGQPVTAVHCMLVLGRLDLRASAIVAPLAIGALTTAVGALMGVVSFRRGRHAAVFAWFIIADAVAPLVAFAGHALAVAVFAAPAV